MVDEYVKIFKLLADKSRLKIIASLLKEGMYVELIAERLNLSPSTVSFHLKKLENEGLVYSKKDQYYVTYYLNYEKLHFNVIESIQDLGRQDSLEEREMIYRSNVISAFFAGNKLKVLPKQRKKKQIILHEIAKKFEINKPYTEQEVNEIIKPIYEDFCTVRRDMISEKIFVRQQQVYERIV